VKTMTKPSSNDYWYYWESNDNEETVNEEWRRPIEVINDSNGVSQCVWPMDNDDYYYY